MRYGSTLGYPEGWTAYPSERDWTWEDDVLNPRSPAQDFFLPAETPAGDVRVSVWNAPLDSHTRKETTAYLVAWVEDYCKKSDSVPCTGIADRAVELCVEKRDCHPGLLVPFRTETMAFFSGGIYQQNAMTIVAVWRPEGDVSVRRFGGVRALLESFLSTMDVWPTATPVSLRTAPSMATTTPSTPTAEVSHTP